MTTVFVSVEDRHLNRRTMLVDLAVLDRLSPDERALLDALIEQQHDEAAYQREAARRGVLAR